MSTLADGDYDVNELGQPIGRELRDWRAPVRPPRAALAGRFCRAEPVTLEQHAADLHAANRLDRDGRMWTYLAYGPFETQAEYREWLAPRQHSDDPMFFAIVDSTTGRAAGLASYLRIDPSQGAIEVGHLAYSPLLQRTPAATEAMYLLMKYAFELGYRRYEWKCNALNAPSCRAAERLGFTFEGIFRQATISKGRTRDTAWYSIIDSDWPRLAQAYEAWLAPANFDTDGRQRVSLNQLTSAVRERA